MNVGDFVLEVGNMTETITVEAEAGRLQIQTESAERSDLVTNKQLRDMALNGRNIVDLFKTIPGVIAGGTQTTSTVPTSSAASTSTARAPTSTSTRWTASPT